MALSTSNLRFRHNTPTLIAKRGDLYLLAKTGQERSRDARPQVNKPAGIGTPDLRYGTAAAQRRFPGEARSVQQAAHLVVASALVIAVEKFTFRAVRGTHASIKPL